MYTVALELKLEKDEESVTLGVLDITVGDTDE
jgi:hypothetical protein